jgi:hypothetical protein
VRKVSTADGKESYMPILPTKTGSYIFNFNQWIKLSRPPVFSEKG